MSRSGIRVRDEGFDDFAEGLLVELRPGARAAVEEGAKLLAAGIRRKLEGTRSGRTYGEHVAAAPGEAPASLDGHLERAIGHSDVLESGGRRVFTAVAGVGAGPGRDAAEASKGEGVNVYEYASFLENGGLREGVRVPAFPYIRPAVMELEARIAALWERHV